jgi:hypothetical protein
MLVIGTITLRYWFFLHISATGQLKKKRSGISTRDPCFSSEAYFSFDFQRILG